MQYILSQEEMDVFVNRVDPSVHAATVHQAMQAGALLKDEIGCAKKKHNYGYCDDCPLSSLHIACQDDREYSQ